VGWGTILEEMVEACVLRHRPTQAQNLMQVAASPGKKREETGWDGILGSALPGPNPCTRIDIKDGPPREVRSVDHPRIWVLRRIEAYLKSGNDKTERRVNVNIAIESSDGACQTHCRINRLGVINASNHPTHAACVGCVPIPAG